MISENFFFKKIIILKASIMLPTFGDVNIVKNFKQFKKTDVIILPGNGYLILL